jgi:hypothetical protein
MGGTRLGSVNREPDKNQYFVAKKLLLSIFLFGVSLTLFA